VTWFVGGLRPSLGVIHGSLEEGSELLELVSTVQELMEEELEFLLDISG
jgi:hypothetical protein